MKNEIVKLAIILFIITAVAGLVLSMSNELTKDKIAAVNEAKKSGPAVAEAVVPGSSSIEDFDTDLVEKIKTENNKFLDVRECKDSSGKVLGYGISTLSIDRGYGGDIEIILGISMDGKIVGIKIVNMKETAGLGTGVSKPKFQEQYIGKTTDTPFVVSKSKGSDTDVEAVSGATISSRSITSAINNAMDIFNKYIKK